jgi:hypothetical protein
MTPRFSTGGVLLTLLLIASAPQVIAASLMTIDDPARMSFGGFASSLATVGDLDGDGIADYLVGAYAYNVDDPPPAPRAQRSVRQGRAFVFSGKTGKLVLTLNTPRKMECRCFS